ncbi:MAG TPA: acyltransferase [Lacunisphaera sp.]|nr:acyltransferase [Lacunisphaera sp.]
MDAASGPSAVNPGRTPYLDGLRGIAILVVLAAHYLYVPFNPGLHPGSWFLPIHHLLGAGWVGVDLFFVLSGFLLGGILMDHRTATNLFRVFYLRRACRIIPVYFLFLAPLALVPFLSALPALRTLLDTRDIPPWCYPCFLQNVVMTLKGSWGEQWISATWSLAVEEQFYLILPFLIRFVPVRLLPPLLLALTLLAPVLRTMLHAWAPLSQAQVGSYTLLPCRWDSLLLGVLAAWAIRDQRTSAWLQARPGLLRVACLLLAAAPLALAWYSPRLYSIPMRTVGYTLFSLLFACAVVCGHFGVLPGQRVLEGRWLRWMARISYAFYLVHIPIANLVFHLTVHHTRTLDSPRDVGLMAASLAASLTAAALSWKILEKPILDFGRRFSYLAPEKSLGGETPPPQAAVIQA